MKSATGRRRKFTDKEKWCPDCQTWLPLDAFWKHKGTTSGRGYYCKQHTAQRNLPNKSRHDRKKKYGLSDAGFLALWEKQGGLCGICNRPLTKPTKTCVDHNHTTNTTRGLLCESCNRGLGFFFDDPELLQKAINYLKSFTTEPPSVGSLIALVQSNLNSEV